MACLYFSILSEPVVFLVCRDYQYLTNDVRLLLALLDTAVKLRRRKYSYRGRNVFYVNGDIFLLCKFRHL